MKSVLWWVKGGVMLSVLALGQAWGQAAWASEPIENNLQVRDLPRPATTVKEWMAQMEAQSTVAPVPITGVRVEPTATGLDIILETQDGKPLQVDASQFRTEGTSLIADIPNAVLALPQGNEFRTDDQFSPGGGISSVSVTQVDGATVRVTVAGQGALPTAAVTLRVGSVAESLNPKPEDPEEEITVTVEGQRSGYRVPNASTATRTDTPLRDIPQSIQVVPKQVLEDQQVNNLNDALRNVSGVTPGGTAFGTYDIISLRGFVGSNVGNFRRNGLESPNFVGYNLNANTERIEVLKGPASVLFGDLAPGGIINIATKQPLSQPFAQVTATAGSYAFYRGTIDVSGPLNSNRTLLYRLNASYEDAESYRDSFNNNTFFIAPVISWQISDRTRWTVEAEYRQDNRIVDVGLSIPGVPFERIRRLPIDLLLNEPGDDFESKSFSITSTLEHQFSDNWRLRNVLNFIDAERAYSQYTFPDRLRPDGQTLERSQTALEQSINYYFGEVDLIGNFSTGSVKHQLLVGVDYLYRESPPINFQGQRPLLDIENPVYGSNSTNFAVTSSFINPEQRLGLFIQDQVALTDNLKLLIGGRYSNALLQQTNRLTDRLVRDQTVENFSPRVGIVYQPTDWLSLYASYTRSFEINGGIDANGNPFDPTLGTQYEVGAKTDLFDSRLSATLAFYQITRSNVLTPDPNNRLFSIQTGEQKSEGIELDITGQITPNWSVIASYSYNNASITEDNRFPVGNKLPSSTPHSFSLWTKYQFSESLRGLSIGGGIFYVDNRWDSLSNNYQLPAYTRVDAFVAYQFNQNVEAQLNFKNLFNERYYEGTFGSVYPGAPFTVLGTISWQF